VVLGNGVVTYAEGGRVVAIPTRQTAWTVLEGARVYHLIDGPTVIASGGIVVPGIQLEPEAGIIARELERLGVPHDHIVLDSSASPSFRGKRCRTDARPRHDTDAHAACGRAVSCTWIRRVAGAVSPPGLPTCRTLWLAPNPTPWRAAW
jgi:hypothetical protein